MQLTNNKHLLQSLQKDTKPLTILLAMQNNMQSIIVISSIIVGSLGVCRLLEPSVKYCIGKVYWLRLMEPR